jgi:thymidine phosphorylase
VAALRLGAGRERKEDGIDRGVGITVHVAIGDRIEAGRPLATLRWASERRRDQALPLLDRAFSIRDEPVGSPPLIYDEVGGSL